MTSTPTITFTAGCGGSGKSTMLLKHYPTLTGVDPDTIKTAMPSYDAANPHLVHAKSVTLAMREFYARLGAGEDFFFDGTGKNVEKYISLIAAAKAAGFKTRMFFVRAKLETCLARNAARPRVVPAEVILETYQALEVAQSILKHYVDFYEVVNNDY